MNTTHEGAHVVAGPDTSGPAVKPRSRIGMVALALSLSGFFAAVVSGLGYRLGLWTYMTGFIILLSAAAVAVASAALALAGIYQTRPRGHRRGLGWALTALFLGAGTAAVPLSLLWLGRNLPPIHDITTDTADPPNFVAILPLRAGASNSAQYGGAAVATQQRQAYPDIKPAWFSAPSTRVFEAALATARHEGWTVVASDPADGRIEATDTTFWFGFVDDIVVRVAPQPDGRTRVDARSVSRVGLGDLGANARRLHAFLRDLTSRLGGTEQLSRDD